MIDTLRLAQRWKRAENDPEKMVEALAEELARETVGKADLAALEATLRGEFAALEASLRGEIDRLRRDFETFKAAIGTFKAEIRADMASFRNQVLAGQVALFIALATLLLFRT